MRFLAFFALMSLPLSAQPALRYLNLGTAGSACCVATDSGGNVYTVNTWNPDPVQTTVTGIVLTKTDSKNNLIYTFTFDSAGFPRGLAVDSQKNVFLAGSIGLTSPESDAAGFVSKISSSGTSVLFTRLLGGTTPGTGTGLTAVTTDSAGNVYVAGATSSEDYPVSANAYQSTGPVSQIFGVPTYAVLTELSADGSRILYSTFLGGSSTTCNGGSSCIGAYGQSIANSLAVGADGSILVAGQTSASNFPVSSTAVQTTCDCGYPSQTGFVASFSATGGLNWSTFLGGALIQFQTSAALPGRDCSRRFGGNRRQHGQYLVPGHGEGLPVAAFFHSNSVRFKV